MPDSASTSALVLQFEAQVALPFLVGMVGIALAWIKKRLNLQAESTGAQLQAVANATIQTAVGNFAGKVANGVATGAITPANATAQLTDYLKTEAADSMARLKPSPAAIETMLLGKLATAAGVDAPPEPMAAVAVLDPKFTPFAGANL